MFTKGGQSENSFSLVFLFLVCGVRIYTLNQFGDCAEMFGAGDVNAQLNSYDNPMYGEEHQHHEEQQQPQHEGQHQEYQQDYQHQQEGQQQQEQEHANGDDTAPPGAEEGIKQEQEHQPQQQQQQQQQQRQPVNRDAVEGKVFIGGLSLQTSKETVSDYCQQWCVPREA